VENRFCAWLTFTKSTSRETVSHFPSPLQPVLCEASYVLLEYVKTAMFMWMFIEGLFLHNMVTGMYSKCTHMAYFIYVLHKSLLKSR